MVKVCLFPYQLYVLSQCRTTVSDSRSRPWPRRQLGQSADMCLVQTALRCYHDPSVRSGGASPWCLLLAFLFWSDWAKPTKPQTAYRCVIQEAKHWAHLLTHSPLTARKWSESKTPQNNLLCAPSTRIGLARTCSTQREHLTCKDLPVSGLVERDRKHFNFFAAKFAYSKATSCGVLLLCGIIRRKGYFSGETQWPKYHSYFNACSTDRESW